MNDNFKTKFRVVASSFLSSFNCALLDYHWHGHLLFMNDISWVMFLNLHLGLVKGTET